jgi:predicted Zn-dependent protease
MITWPSKLFIFLFFLLPLGLTSGCATPPESKAPLLPDKTLANEDEIMLWQKSAAEQRVLETTGFIYPDQELEDYLNKVVARLQAHSSPVDLEIRVKVIKNAHLNAFAYPNGMIYIHAGLLARMDNEAQLAAVLAHEMTHSIRRHALRAFRKYKDQAAFLRVVEHTLSKTRGLQEIARFMGISGAMAAMSGYTRELEAEADRVGMQVMAAAGYDPGEALALFDHMITEIEQEGLEEPFFFGSHPKVRQRIENLQNLSDLGYINKGSRIKNSEIFLAKLDKLFLDNAGLDIRQGRFQAARRSVEKYLRIKPDDTRAYFLLGEIFRQRGQVDDATKAIKYYNQAIFLDPTYADPHKAIGLIHYKKGKHTLAKKFFEACLQLSPDSPDKAYIQAYLKQFEQNGEG